MPALRLFKGPSGSALGEFDTDQWWFKELGLLVKNGTDDQKRALAVVENLLKTVDAALDLEVVPQGTLLEEKTSSPSWGDAERISELPDVDYAIRALLDNPTGDNGTGAVLAVMEAVRENPLKQSVVAATLLSDQELLQLMERMGGTRDSDLLKFARDVLSASHNLWVWPAGWKLVPEEPTPEMIQAACDKHGYPGRSRWVYLHGYREMLKVSPKAPNRD